MFQIILGFQLKTIEISITETIRTDFRHSNVNKTTAGRIKITKMMAGKTKINTTMTFGEVDLVVDPTATILIHT